MGALKGSLSYARFFVQGEVPDDFRDTFVERVRLRAFRPLSPEEEAPERSGWCSIERPFDLELDYEKVFYNNFLNLGFRTDRWVVPAPLLRAKLEEAEDAYRKKKGREKLGKGERDEIKQMVLRRLRQKVVPSMRVVDFSWSIEEGLVRFFSHAQKSATAMADLFEKTFALKLVPESPYTTAARRGLSRDEEEFLAHLEPTSFVESAFLPCTQPS